MLRLAQPLRGYRETHRFLSHGPKPTCLVIHPVKTGRNREFEIWRAVEALRLVQSCGWDVFEGLNEPRGGWDETKTATQQFLSPLEKELPSQTLGQSASVSPWSSAIVEKFHLFDCDDAAFLDERVRRKYAESFLVRLHKTNEETFLDSGKTEELLVALGKAVVPPRYVVINSHLTPTQLLRLNVLAGQAMLAWKSRRKGDLQATARLKQLTGYLPEDEHEQYDFRTQNCVPEYIEVIDRSRLILEVLYKQSQNRIVRGEMAGSSANPGSTGSVLKRQLELQKILWMSKNLISANAASIDKRFTDALNTYVAGFKETVTFGNIVIDASQRRLGKSNRQYISDLVKFQLVRLRKRIDTQKLHRQRLFDKNTDFTLHVGLVGYVNVGKTTLFNSLVHAIPANKRAKDCIVSSATRRQLLLKATATDVSVGLLGVGDRVTLALTDGPPTAVEATAAGSTAVTVAGDGQNALVERMLAQAELTETLDIPFETVEPRSARLRLPTGLQVVLHDTPGFVDDCPYFMFETFQGGFDFLRNCHLILHVRDASCPFNDHQANVVQDALLLAGLQDADIRDVWTKTDLLQQEPTSSDAHVSGLTGDGVQELVDLVDSYSSKILRKRRLRISFSAKQAPEILRLLRLCVSVVYDDSYDVSENGEELAIECFAGPNEEGKLRARLAEFEGVVCSVH